MEDGGLPAMASAALAELRKAARLEGAAIIDMARPDAASVLLFDAGPGVPEAIGSAHQMLRRSPDAPSYMVAPDKRPILVSPWVLHRHHTLWDEPELFDPERFAPGRREAIHRFAYLPFGAGPRICIGMAFALQEAMLLLVTILQRYRLTLREGFAVMPNATITLRPEGGLPMRAERRG